MALKEIYDHPQFHGLLSDEEAYNLCREELTNTGKKTVDVWHLTEINGELHGRSSFGIIRSFDGTFGLSHLKFCNSLDKIHEWMFCRGISQHLLENTYIKRKNPPKLGELARIATLDSFVDYCCLKNLIQRIDELQIPTTEKEELKKLVRGFKVLLASKIPNEQRCK